MTDKTASRRAILPGDILIYIIVTAAAILTSVAIGVSAGAPEYVEVTAKGVTTRYPLDIDREITLTGEGYTLLLIIEDKSAYIEEADCPDRLCVQTGKITKSGRSIVCVPARISVRLAGGKDSDDAVAG